MLTVRGRWRISWGLAGAGFIAAMVVATSVVGARPALADAPILVSSHGITVSSVRWVSQRTLEADISSPLIAANAVNGPHRVRVTLPDGYFQNPATRYPVVYLLHGGAGGNSAQWTGGGGDAEGITRGKPVIVVMPDGGKVGWYTNWVNQSAGAQNWADFIVNQVIPWTDRNLRTIPAKNGRAIAGLSMGGYGAVRLAQDRPDMFASVASFSGAVDLGDWGTRTVITEESVRNGFPADGPFGNPFWPFDSVWRAKDPMNRASRLAGLQVLLYAGAGANDVDVVERMMGQSADRFSRRLTEHGIPHFWWMYGRPGPSVPYGCDGGHNFSCWNFAFNDALPRMLEVLAKPTTTNSGSNRVANPGFESGLAYWRCSGSCGADLGKGFARTGSGNGRVRNSSGWNDLHQVLTVEANRNYLVSAWIRTSPNNSNGYFGLRTAGGKVVGETRFYEPEATPG